MAFRAFMVTKEGDDFTAGLCDLNESDLMPGEVTINVEWSSVNYKDGLAATPGGRVVTRYPMVIGIDMAGTVVSSSDSRFSAGDSVIGTGYELGTGHYGGFAELARIPADWVAPLPDGLTAKEAMALGTGGFTAAQSIDALERSGLRPETGAVIVTGATGGVGSTAVSMLAGLGYKVIGSTGKASEHDFLKGLGASDVIDRAELSEGTKRPLDSQRYAGAIDPVGGTTTATLLTRMQQWGSVALSGLAGGVPIATTVMPFILRGVNLLGIDSVQLPMPDRQRIWARCASDLKPRGLLDSIAQEVDLNGLGPVLSDIIPGKIRGRVLVRVS